MISPVSIEKDALGLGQTAVIAGSGALPLVVAERLAAQGAAPFIVLLRGNADNALRLYPHSEIEITHLAKLVRLLKSKNIHNIILAGGVARRPNLRDLHWDWPTLRALPFLFKALKQGDDALLRAFIRIMEYYGFRVIGAHEIVPGLLSPKNTNTRNILTRKSANKAERANIAVAVEAVHLLGKLDIGQGAVAVGGRVVALEGAEGTDAMLERVAHLRRIKKIPDNGGVLVKMKKPQQEIRADLPTIGPKTIANIYKAGLAGLAVEAGGSLILESKKVVEQADKYGLFLQSL